MELDELKTAWRELDRRLETGQAISLRVLKELKLDKTRSALRRLASVLKFELACGVLAMVLLGMFLAKHYDTARFAVSAIALDAVALFTIVASAWQIARITGLDYSAPVVKIQHEIAELRALRVRVTRWLLLLSPLLWTPFAIVAAQGLFGFDVYQAFGPAWIWANLGFGLAFIPPAIWVARRCSERFGTSPWFSRLVDDIAGGSLASAKKEVDEIARFEEEC